MKDREKSFLESLQQTHATFGIGDDGVEIPCFKEGCVVASDAFFEDVHFRTSWSTLNSIVEKCFLVNLSDIYAMNAIPTFCLITLSIPKNFLPTQNLARIFGKCALKYGLKIIGGDTLVGDKLHISLTLLGRVKKKILRRNGIKRGDVVGYIEPKSVLTHCKTHKLGQNFKHLKASLRFHKNTKLPQNTRFMNPVLYPQMLFELNSFARAGMDISDGIFMDLARLSHINRVHFRLFKPKGMWFYAPEEYQMLYAIPKRNLKTLQKRALKYRHRFVPFGVAIRGKMRNFKRNWHS